MNAPKLGGNWPTGDPDILGDPSDEPIRRIDQTNRGEESWN